MLNSIFRLEWKDINNMSSGGHRVVALVPAHNEAGCIQATIDSLCQQTVPPQRVIIIADNCTDATVDIVHQNMGQYPMLEVFQTVGNQAKKAGALNQALALLDLGQWNFLLQMDADTVIDNRLIEQALKEFERQPNLAGVGSRCHLKPFDQSIGLWGRTLWRFQNLEYGIADSRHIQRRGHAKVLAGAVCLYRADVLQQILDQNQQQGSGPILWPENSLVEDYELTLDVQSLGFDTEIGLKMFSRTDAMFSLPDLWKQRFRWYGGTAATLRRRGLSKQLRKEALIQLAYVVVIMARLALIGLLLSSVVWGMIGTAPVQFSATWALVPIIALILGNYVYRFRGFTRDRDLTQWLMVVLLVPIELYITYDQLLTLCAYTKNLLSPSKSW